MKAVAFLLSFAASVAAHGYVDNGTIGGTSYQVGHQPSGVAWDKDTNISSSTNVSRLKPDFLLTIGIFWH